MRDFFTALVSTVFIGFLSLSPASAASIPFHADLDCAAANAGVGTCGDGGTGTGVGTLTFDDTTNLLEWVISWSGLSAGPATAAHFHGPATPAQNAGIIEGIDIVSPAIGSEFLNSSQAADLLNDLWYINIHTVAFPGGEIRGQVNVVPIPAAVWLFGSALGFLGWTKRRQAA